MKTKILSYSKILLLTLYFIFGCVVTVKAAMDVPPLPDKFQKDATKREVEGAVSPQIRQLLGVWEGIWQGNISLDSADFQHQTYMERKAKIVVWKVSNNEISLLYGYGPSNLSEKSSWYQRKARISKDGESVKLHYKGPKSGDSFDYVLQGDLLRGESKGLKINLRKIAN